MKLRFFSNHEMVVLGALRSAYGKVAAEVFFNHNEILVLKYLMNVTDRQNIKKIAEETGLSRPTTKKALESLKQKEAIDGEVNGVSYDYWIRDEPLS